MQVLCEHNNSIIDITQACSDISLSESLNEGASSVSIKYVADGLILDNGDPIRITGANEKAGIFFGNIFKVNVDADKLVSVKAYDQLRYLKAKDIVVLENPTLKDILVYACNKLSLKLGNIADTKIKLSTVARYDKTYLDLIVDGIKDTLVLSGAKDFYVLRDVYGSVCLMNANELALPVVLGTNSLVTGFSYEKSIDDNYYNVVKILYKDESQSRNDLSLSLDQNAINKLGILQYFEFADSIKDKQASKQRANDLLKLYNKEKESLRLQCLGDLSIRAGCSIYASIEDIKLDRRLIVKSVSHKFLPFHTMNIEVIANG